MLWHAAFRTPVLTPAQEFSLATGITGDNGAAARERLVMSHLRLVVAIAGKYRHYGLPASDLRQEGTVGLLEAVNRYDLSRNRPFNVFARAWIQGTIQSYILANWSIVRLGKTTAQKTLFFRLRATCRELGLEPDELADIRNQRKVAQKLSVRIQDVASMSISVFHRDRSLSGSYSHDIASRQPVETTPARSPEDMAIHSVDGARFRDRITAAVAELPGREQIIIKGRCLRDRARSLQEIGTELGLSRERVRQLEHHAICSLRARLRDPLSAQASRDQQG